MEASGKPDTIRMIRVSKSNNPRIDTVIALARVLETSIEWLATGKGDENASGRSVRSISPEIVENVAFALQDNPTARKASPAAFARTMVDLCIHLSRNPNSPLDDLIAFEIDRSTPADG